jgi:HPt (histidine-containing phosphotransfer) domain-containing protein
MPNQEASGLVPVFLNIPGALAQVGDTAALSEMLDMLQDTLNRDLEKIDQLLAAGDVHGANRVLHPLKGFIPIFCSEELCEHLKYVELLSKTQSSAEVTPAFALLRSQLEQLQTEVDNYLG